MINLSDETSTERSDHDQNKEEDLCFEAPPILQPPLEA